MYFRSCVKEVSFVTLAAQRLSPRQVSYNQHGQELDCELLIVWAGEIILYQYTYYAAILVFHVYYNWFSEEGWVG